MSARLLGSLVAALGVTATAATVAAAAPAAHPRVLLTPALRATWQGQAKTDGSAVRAAVVHCADVAARPGEFAPSGYQQLDWAKNLQACLVAFVATADDAHARTAMTYFRAMLDDRATVGDGAGGDELVTQDSGFAIRAIGPYTALAYDWLYDHALMNDDLRATARHRFAAWAAWYAANGYRARGVGTNYHAGYVMAATLMAAAARGDGNDDVDNLWDKVTGEIWGKDMAGGLAAGGVLEGGDWGEGWQYGPLAVANYAVAGRVLAEAGVAVPGLGVFLDAVLVRHLQALSPDDGVFAGGDTEAPSANLEPNANTLAAVAIGAATPASRDVALGELARLSLTGPGAERQPFPLLIALAAASGTPTAAPRTLQPTWYLAPGTGNLYARSSWDAGAAWTVMQCTASLEIDHFHANAGNVVLSRGADDLLIDPSPYGTMSTLTSNAPTVASAHLPANYIPGQAYWSERTGWAWAHQTHSGVVAARCDYADQYKFQHRPSDVPHALRDLVMVPWPAPTSGGVTDATLVVIDRAASGDARRPLHTRWRLPGNATLAGDVGQVVVGASRLTVQRVASSSGALTRVQPTMTDCFGEGVPRGNCDAARLPVTDLRLEVAGPTMEAVHVLDSAATGTAITPARELTGAGYRATWLERAGGAAAIVRASDPPWQPHAGDFSYVAPARANAHHVVLDAPAEQVAIAARKVGDDCEVTLSAGGAVAARPLHVTLDAACAVTPDVTTPTAAVIQVAAGALGSGSDAVDHGTQGRVRPRSARSGCCGAQASPSASLAMAGVVVATLLRRRRRTKSCGNCSRHSS